MEAKGNSQHTATFIVELCFNTAERRRLQRVTTASRTERRRVTMASAASTTAAGSTPWFRSSDVSLTPFVHGSNTPSSKGSHCLLNECCICRCQVLLFSFANEPDMDIVTTRPTKLLTRFSKCSISKRAVPQLPDWWSRKLNCTLKANDQ